MLEPLDGLGVQRDVVGGPERAEFVALGGELADEVLELSVVRVAAVRGSKRGSRCSVVRG